jgi:hypothetical protein
MLKKIKGLAATAAVAVTASMVPVFQAAAETIIIICDRSGCLVIIIY